MTKDEAKNLLLNAAWLGTDETREKTEEAVRMAIDALSQQPCEKCVYSTKDGYCQYDDIAETIPPLEPCEDAISRTAVLNTLDSMDKALDENRTIEEYKELLRECYEQLPPVTPQQNVENPCIECGMNCCVDEVCKKKNEFLQQKVGKWIIQDIHNCHTNFKCSECGYMHNFMHLYGEPTADYPYCPSCGAKMAESEVSE